DAALPPALVNGAILAAVVWLVGRRGAPVLPMPFSLARLQIFARLPDEVQAHVRPCADTGANERQAVVDIDLYDLQGRCVARMEAFTLVFPVQPALLLAVPDWTDAPGRASASASVQAPVLVFAGAHAELRQAAGARWPTAEQLALPADVPAGLAALLARLQRHARDGAGRPLLLLLDDSVDWRARGLVGLLRTFALEHPAAPVRAVWVPADVPAAIAAVQLELAAPGGEVEVRHAAGGRQLRDLRELSLTRDAARWPAAADVVWITGGLGGIGRALAREFALARGARVVLGSRSRPDADAQAFLADLRGAGAEVMDLQVDVGDATSVATALQQVLHRFGRLDAIVHAAGVLRDGYLADKTPAQLEAVLHPKLAGVLALDAATRDLPLKAFLLCSSIAGALGNPGQGDYAAANALLDGFAAERRRQVAAGQRSGVTVSLNWPLWRDGGMHMGAAQQELMEQATGMVAMDTASGLRALESALAADQPQVLVAHGDRARMLRALRGWAAGVEAVAAPAGVAAAAYDGGDAGLRQAVAAELVRLVAQVQRIPVHKIALERELSDYGFDSISFTELANALNRAWGLQLMPTLFFETPDLGAVADHLLARHRDALVRRMPTASTLPVAARETQAPARAALAVAVPLQLPVPVSTDTDAIAIIGMGGKFPGATDLEDFWRKLEACEDLVSEVPATRWDWRELYGDPHQEPGKTRVKWGGFVGDADCFDAPFFGISRAEAEAMDPQLRMFLESVWATLEDAGIPPGTLAGSRTGVFAGVATADYKDLLAEARRQGQVRSPAEPFPFMVANRVSWWFNFRGPSEVIDTACSSSLIAVHRAVESLRSGQCTLALAGGVNLLGSPRLTVASSQAGLLSEDGRCMSFDARANGYVRSEGAAVLLLKPLARAVADGDRIHGVILASGENHGGRSASPTAPNALAQRELLADVQRRAG
ncbi:MAG TPA: SDR family NAD(P)-dependent oxidoreductase, partial [Ramlibacter sp.]